MNYQAFTNDTLLLMHHAARGALAVDDELSKLGKEGRFRVRETSDWMTHAAELEAEMFRRGMNFDPIKWSRDEASVRHLPDAPALADPAVSPTLSCEGQAVPSVSRLRSKIAAVLKTRSSRHPAQ